MRAKRIPRKGADRVRTHADAKLRPAFEWGKKMGQNGRPGQQVKRVLAGQGITSDAKAVLGFFALLVIGVFVLGKIDQNLDQGTLAKNYSDSANETSGGFLDYVQIAVVLPIVIVGGIMLGVIFRFI